MHVHVDCCSGWSKVLLEAVRDFKQEDSSLRYKSSCRRLHHFLPSEDQAYGIHAVLKGQPSVWKWQFCLVSCMGTRSLLLVMDSGQILL